MKRWQMIVGIGLVLLGIFALIEVLTGIDLWRFVFPMILVGIGLLLILRPKFAGRDIWVEMPILGDIRKKGEWEVRNHEIWLIVGTTRLDFTDARFPEGEGEIKLFGFVNDLKVILPSDVGFRFSGLAFVSEYKDTQIKEERFMSILEHETPNYADAEKRVHVKTVGFVSEIRIKPPVL
jgi:predicted membrane protein